MNHFKAKFWRLQKQLMLGTIFGIAGAVVFFASPAFAGIGISVTPDFPATVTVGDTGIPVGLEFQNNSTADVGTIDITEILFTPQCGDLSVPCTSPDPGVFSIGVIGNGADACTGVNFTIVEVDAGTGRISMTPDVSPLSLDLGATCRINFTADAMAVPSLDAAGAAGKQTVQSGQVSAIDPDTELPGTGTGTDITTVEALPLEVVKSAETTFTRTWEWLIEKSVDPDTWWMFAGDSGMSTYDVTVTKTGFVDSDWAVSGTISIHNPNTNGTAATIESVDDMVSGVGAAAVDCGVVFPFVLSSDDTLNCTYGMPLPDGTNRVNTATVTTSGPVPGGSDDADVLFGDPTRVVNGEINVNDTNGEAWVTSDTMTWNYDRTFDCSRNPADYTDGHYMYTHPNVATIVETQQSDDALVTVHCYAPVVSKDAHTSFTRTWEWRIDKSGDQTDLTLAIGEVFAVNYDVTVSAVSVDSDWMVTGDITVMNPHPTDAMNVTLTDIVSPDIAATLDCGGVLVVPAASSATCGYSADLPDGSMRTNTATATMNAIDFMAQADVDFATATMTEVDECIDVFDDHGGFLGTVCADQAPITFQYSLDVGPYETCGTYEFVNIASFITNDTGSTGNDSWTVNVTVPCPGCTLTQGYWKTHNDSHWGGAPTDDNWMNIGDWDGDTVMEGEQEDFVPGLTWFEVFTTPVQGRVWYQLAHQWMAAYLNMLNGASTTPAVDSALTNGWAWLASHDPDVKLKGAAASDPKNWASILGSYNEGLIGPGHCDEQNPV